MLVWKPNCKCFCLTWNAILPSPPLWLRVCIKPIRNVKLSYSWSTFPETPFPWLSNQTFCCEKKQFLPDHIFSLLAISPKQISKVQKRVNMDFQSFLGYRNFLFAEKKHHQLACDERKQNKELDSRKKSIADGKPASRHRSLVNVDR